MEQLFKSMPKVADALAHLSETEKIIIVSGGNGDATGVGPVVLVRRDPSLKCPLSWDLRLG